MLDTGCSRTMVHRNLVSEAHILDGESAVVRCAHGDSRLYLMAKVNVAVDGCTISIVSAVSDTLPMDVPLGTDVPELGKLLSRISAEFGGGSDALEATTKARARQEAEAERESLQKQQRQCRLQIFSQKYGMGAMSSTSQYSWEEERGHY